MLVTNHKARSFFKTLRVKFFIADAIEGTRSGNFPEDNNLKCFFKCLLITTGMVTFLFSISTSTIFTNSSTFRWRSLELWR